MTGILFIAIAIMGVSLSLLVFRADPKRWDNRIFALMCTVDAINEAVRGLHLLEGRALTDPRVIATCHIGTIFVCYLTTEFAYSFPFNRPMPAKLRAIGLSGALITAFLCLHPETRVWASPISSYYYFLPYFLVTLFLLGRNYQRLGRSRDFLGVPMIMVAIALRWVSGMSTFIIAKNISPEAFSLMLYVDAIPAIVLCYTLIAFSLLQHQLFRVRGFLADVVLHFGIGTAVLLLMITASDLVLSRATTPVQLHASVVGLSLLPLATIAFVRWLLPKIEEAILCPINPRRALMKGVLEKVVHETAGSLSIPQIMEVARNALVEISGGRVELWRGAQFPDANAGTLRALPPAIAGHLSTTAEFHLHRLHAHTLAEAAREELDQLAGDLVVPVRRSGSLYAALSIEGGTVDRDSVQTAVAIADHLALKLENYELFANRLLLQSQLEEAKRLAALGSFAAAIAHDIRTPLTSVQLNVQILRSKAKLPPDDMEYFDIALDELKRLNAHISELLDYAKPIQVKQEPVDLRDIVDDALRGMEPLFSDRQLRLERLHADVLPTIVGDATRIRQVLLNLLENAAQATGHGGSIQLTTRAVDRVGVALEVSDTGKGIEAENLQKIFEPFFTTRADGTGLGLAIAQKLVRAHGGEIQVRSLPGQGSTFTIVLPAGSAI